MVDIKKDFSETGTNSFCVTYYSGWEGSLVHQIAKTLFIFYKIYTISIGAYFDFCVGNPICLILQRVTYSTYC